MNSKSFFIQHTSKTCGDIVGAINFVLEKADIFNRHNVEFYLSGTGLAVDLDYTGRGNLMANEVAMRKIKLMSI